MLVTIGYFTTTFSYLFPNNPVNVSMGFGTFSVLASTTNDKLVLAKTGGENVVFL